MLSLSSELYTDVGVLVHHTLYTAVVGMVWPLLGSRQNGQAIHTCSKNVYPVGSTLSIAV